MTIGAGKYDDECTTARVTCGAQAALLIVLGGNKGTGFALQTRNVAVLVQLPEILETVARDIREDLKKGKL